MLGHWEVVVGFHVYGFVAVHFEEFQVHAHGFRVAGDVQDFRDVVPAQHVHLFVVHAGSRRIHHDHVRFFRQLVQLFPNVAAQEFAVGNPVQLRIVPSGFHGILHDFHAVYFFRL